MRDLSTRVAAAHASATQAVELLTEARVEAGTGDADAARRYLNRAMATLQEAAREIEVAQRIADAPRAAAAARPKIPVFRASDVLASVGR